MRYLAVLLFMMLASGFACDKEKIVVAGAGRFDLYLDEIKGKNVGILANHTSLVDNKHLVDTLLALGVNIKNIYSPEHGFRGEADAGEIIVDGIDPRSGIPVISLYGAKKQPFCQPTGFLGRAIFRKK